MDEETCEKLEAKLRTLTEELNSFSELERAEILHFVDVGEFGVAIETAFGIALEEQKKLTPSNKEAIMSIAAEMGIADSLDIDRLQ